MVKTTILDKEKWAATWTPRRKPGPDGRNQPADLMQTLEGNMWCSLLGRKRVSTKRWGPRASPEVADGPRRRRKAYGPRPPSRCAADTLAVQLHGPIAPGPDPASGPARKPYFLAPPGVVAGPPPGAGPDSAKKYTLRKFCAILCPTRLFCYKQWRFFGI